MNEEQVRQVYSEVIFERGLNYFNEGRVLSAIKLREKMFGEVIGTDRYRTEVDLDNLESRCSCPYGINCKHGVALLLQYFNGEYVDGDDVMKRLGDMDKAGLVGVIEKLVSLNPDNLLYLGAYSLAGASGKRAESLDKDIRSRLRILESEYVDPEFADDLAKFIKVNEDALTKEQIFYVLEFLIKNADSYGYFYDDYSDNYFGNAIFESLCDAFAKKELMDADFERLEKLSEIDDNYMLGPFLNRMVALENAVKLKDFEGIISGFLDEHSYVEFLINCGQVEKARRRIEKDESLGKERRFRLYLRIDRDGAVDFARKNGFYSNLMQYYHEIGAHDEAIGLFKEVVSDPRKRKYLEADPYLYRDIFDSINKSEKKEGLKDVLRILFDICYSFEFYGLCADVGIKLNDKGLLRKLIDKKSGYYFDSKSKIRLLKYLKEDYMEEVVKELKEFAEALIDEKSSYAYERAAEGVFLLREIMSEREWEWYVKKLYGVHSRKMNLWNEFKKRGIYLKAAKGVVSMEVRG